MPKDGHIYKRGTIYWIKYYRSGKPYYESTKSTKEADAKRLLRQRLGQISEGRFIGLQPERVKFEDLAQDFVNDYRINGKRSLDKAERSVRHLQRFFGGIRAVDITTDKVRAYVKVRCSPLSRQFDAELTIKFCADLMGTSRGLLDPNTDGPLPNYTVAGVWEASA